MSDISTQVLHYIVKLLDIPPSHYRKAVDRYESLGEWFCREQSTIAAFSPSVYPQGSFRYGTVIRPLLRKEEYDLDLVCQLKLDKTISQEKLKELVGNEVQAYAKANGILSPVKEKYRCWRLDYADDVSFHMDILPSIPEDSTIVSAISSTGVPIEIAETTVAITDNRLPNYSVISTSWPNSNPKGFAEWFEGNMRAVAQKEIRFLVQKGIYTSVDEVPPFEWKTPLQRSIQILKRHRDVMFKDDPKFKPISMIITTSATHAYNGESDLDAALSTIVQNMSNFIKPTAPRVPNPVNPGNHLHRGEDFADKWQTDSRYEENFKLWHMQVKQDLESLKSSNTRDHIDEMLRRKFAVTLTEEMKRSLPNDQDFSGISVLPSANLVAPPKPWAKDF